MNMQQSDDPRFRALGMYHDHSYIVTGAEVASGNQRVLVRNPWGVRYRQGEVPPGGSDNAEFWVAFRDVEPLIQTISVG